MIYPFDGVNILTISILFIFNRTAHAQPQAIQVYAASSLTNAFIELAAEFEAQHKTQVLLNFAGSSTLAAQIQQGAPADVFASANPQQMQRLVDDDFVDAAQVVTFAQNELVLITPANNPAHIQTIMDLTQPHLWLVLAASAVPIRDYTDDLFEHINEEHPDFTAQALNNLVSEEPNVRQVVARIALGEADAGIVYRSDVTPDIADDLHVIHLPPNTSPRAQYPIAPLVESSQPKLAQNFIDYVLSDE